MSVVATLAIGAVVVVHSGNSGIAAAQSVPIEYGMSFNNSTNKFFSGTGSTDYSGSTTLKTKLGNNITFNYGTVAGGSSSNWHLIKDGGFFYNSDPIHGIEQLNVTCTASGKTYKVYWGNTLDFDLGNVTITSNSDGDTINFDEEYPTYFKFENINGGNISIKNMELILTCANNYPTLSISSENETMGTVSGDSGVVRSGSNATIVATPNQGYKFVGWYDGENLVSTNASYTFSMGYKDINYVAKFTYESYNLVVQSESETKGIVSESSGSYDYLTPIEISAVANTGYTFSGWYNGSTLVSTDNPYSFIMPYNDLEYIAKFSTNSYQLSLVNANPEFGSISGSGSYLYGSNPTITATPNTGVSFLGWYDGEDQLVSNLASYTFTMPYNDLEYTAKFAWTPYSVNLSVNDSTMGSVSGDGSYHYGQEVTLVATPNEHYSFFGWYNGEELLSQEETYVFDMPNNSLNYEARFVRNYNLVVYSDDESMGTVTAPSEWGAGLEVTVTANNNEGYVLDYWANADYDEVAYTPTYTFTMPSEDVELIAVFAEGYHLTLSSSDESKGTVSGSGDYAVGKEVTATMTYISGTFKGWYDSNGNLVSKNNPYVFNMPSNDYVLIATFMTQAEEAWNKSHGVIPVVDTVSKTVTYGLYPQTNVNDSTLISNLNTLTTPESNGWYLYEGEYYAKVTAKPYDSNYVFNNGNTIVDGTTYWFLCEAITWDILSNSDDQYYLLSDVLLDAHCYYTSTSSRTINNKTVYANNYQYSDIRAWLNGYDGSSYSVSDYSNAGFLDTAFALDYSYIQTTTVDNSAATTDSIVNKYACENTDDKIFLPSYQDYLNSSYGFSKSTYSSSTRECKTTDYARARGAYYGTYSDYLYNGWYWTRSPHSSLSDRAWGVDSDGNLRGRYVHYTYGSVRPSLSLLIS